MPKRTNKEFVKIAIFLAILFGLPVILEGFGWWPFDPSNTIRGSAPSVPTFPTLSEEAVILELKKIAEKGEPESWTVETLELSDGDRLKIRKVVGGGSLTETVAVSLSELDRLIVAEKFKGREPWKIGVYCANYRPCLEMETARRSSVRTHSANYDSWFFPAHGIENTRKALGLFNRLLKLNRAKSTIDTRPSITYIKRQYDRR